MSSGASSEQVNPFGAAFNFIFQKEEDDSLDEKTGVLVEFVMRYGFYAALVAILLMIIALIVKLIRNFDEGIGQRPVSTIGENTRLLFSSSDKSNVGRKVITVYGTNEGNHDLESGRGNEDDWYDGKMCVICYDFPRNCFFIPCGHCVSCINCAHRIRNEEIKNCPICRGIIDKLRNCMSINF